MNIQNLTSLTFSLLCALTLSIHAAEVTVTDDPRDAQGPHWLGPPARYMEDVLRYRKRPKADKALRKPETATRQDYLGFIGSDSSYGAEAIAANPDRGPYGVRHAFPALAQYDADPKDRYAEAIKKCLRLYGQTLRERHENNEHSITYGQAHYDPWLLCLHRKIFKRHGAWSEAEQKWFQELLLFITRNLHVWGGPEHYWRGPMHRPTSEGMTKMLVSTLFPDVPEAKKWRAYARRQWQDWWKFRDNPINDINYFHCQVMPLILGSHILEREEVFEDSEMKRFWDRLIHMTTPDGAVVPFGPSWGWNSHAGERMAFLEIVAAHTGDGRYRFVAHRIFDQIRYQKEVLRRHHILDHFNQLGAALCYFLADDSVEPVTPDAGSTVLYHKETLRVKDKEAARNWLDDLSEDPLKAHIGCRLLCTEKEMPFKLVLRSGWEPGDLYMLVDLFPRHEPMNVTGILGLTRWNAPTTHAISSKSVTDWVNMFKVDDLSGTAPVVTNENPRTVDAFYQEVDISAFSDHPLATYAAVDVRDLNGYPMKLRREFFFVKNRFVLVRDTAMFRESFLARIGPTWWTQNVGPQVGDHWANTCMSGPISFNQEMKTPPVDLLVYHAPRGNRRLLIQDATGDVRRTPIPYTLRYAEDGVVEPGEPVRFAQLLMPLIPSRKPVRSNVPGAASREEIFGQYMAGRVKVVVDDADQTLWRTRAEKGREEWILLNDRGTDLEAGPLSTDARRAYVDVREDKPDRILALDGTYLALEDEDVFRQPDRRDFSTE